MPANDSVATCAIPSWLGPSVIEILFRRGNEDYDVDNGQEVWMFLFARCVFLCMFCCLAFAMILLSRVAA